jgi:hypothetical protein
LTADLRTAGTTAPPPPILTLIGAGALLTGLGLARGDTLTTKGRIMLDAYPPLSRGLVQAATFPLIEAIHGRRSRRFAKGASIPDGPSPSPRVTRPSRSTLWSRCC